MSDLDLRRANDDDHQGLVNLMACCFGEEANCVLDVARDYPYLQAVRQYYSGGGGDILVAENHLGIVGMISWLPNKIDTNAEDFGLSQGMLLHHLFVHPLCRRQRLGMDLMFAAIDIADAVNCPIIEAWMNIKFHRGHKFLRFFTFDVTPETRAISDLQKSTERRYLLDVDDFLDALDQDQDFHDDFFAPTETPSPTTDHDGIDHPSQFVEDKTESWR